MTTRPGSAEWTDDGTSPWDRLASEMRRLKDAAELSYAGLAERTHYSRSSWERFLNRKQLPTRVAVEQFAAAAGQDARPLLEHFDRCVRHAAALRSAGRKSAPVPGPRPGPAARCSAAAPGTGRAGRAPARPDGLRALALASAAGAVLGSALTVSVTLARAAAGRHGAGRAAV